MSPVIKSAELAEKLYVSHNLIKTLVKKNNIPYRPDRQGGFILSAESEKTIAELMMAGAHDKKLARIRAAAGQKGSQTRMEKKLSNENTEEPKAKRTRTTTTQA